MESLRELYKVGNGPSSSHTMGPARAAKVFMGRYPEATSYEAVLYGSLAATGEGHLTDYIIIKTMDPKPVKITWRPEDFRPFHPNAMQFIAYNEANEEIGPAIRSILLNKSTETNKNTLDSYNEI